MESQSRGFKDLIVYQKAFLQATEIYKESLKFPVEEKYSLIDQIRRSSRSVCVNLAEGYRKRDYKKHFLLKITDCMGENSETEIWLDFALNCAYFSNDVYTNLKNLNDEVSRLLVFMYQNPEKFGVKS